MRHGRAASFNALAAFVLLLSRVATAEAPAPAPSFDRERPRWSELEFSASKFLMSATARVEARVRPSREIIPRLLGTPAGRPVAAGDDVLEMTYSANGLGMESSTTLWADPVSGGTLQRTQLDGGGRQRQRTYRFTDVGAYHYTRWPATSREESLGPAEWTERTEGMRPYSDGAQGKPVTEATVLLWLVAAADLGKAGDRLETFTFSRKRVSRVIAQVAGTRSVDVDYTAKDASGEHRRRGQVNALRVLVHGSPLTGVSGDDEEFELLGLHGNLELLLDPQTRAPLELRGRVKIVGQVVVRLHRMMLR